MRSGESCQSFQRRRFDKTEEEYDLRFPTEEMKHQMTLEGLADVDAGRVISHDAMTTGGNMGDGVEALGGDAKMISKKDEARERFHVAKLALFNVRLLSTLERSEAADVMALIESEKTKNGVLAPLSLLHQATFLSVAYICNVWLLESARKLSLEDGFYRQFSTTAKSQNIGLPVAENVTGPRLIDSWESVLRLIRNALSHGNVVAQDGHFLLSDQVKHGKKKENDATTLKLSWAELGQISETCIFALNPLLWPDPEQ